MRLALLLALLLAAGCRSTEVRVPPPVPPEATTLLLTDAEPPRTLYAAAWGAFALEGWDVVEHDSDGLRFTVRHDAGTLGVRVVPGPEGEALLVTDQASPELLAAAGRALASVPGRITYR